MTMMMMMTTTPLVILRLLPTTRLITALKIHTFFWCISKKKRRMRQAYHFPSSLPTYKPPYPVSRYSKYSFFLACSPYSLPQRKKNLTKPPTLPINPHSPPPSLNLSGISKAWKSIKRRFFFLLGITLHVKHPLFSRTRAVVPCEKEETYR